MNDSKRLVAEFKSFYSDLQKSDLGELGKFYANDIVFVDPVHKIRGLVELEDYFGMMCSDLEECRFEYLDELIEEDSAYVKWIMHFRHPRLGKRLISVRGVSHLKFHEKIVFHEDFYDMGAMLYEQLPLLGNVTRWLRLRLAS